MQTSNCIFSPPHKLHPVRHISRNPLPRRQLQTFSEQLVQAHPLHIPLLNFVNANAESGSKRQEARNETSNVSRNFSKRDPAQKHRVSRQKGRIAPTLLPFAICYLSLF